MELRERVQVHRQSSTSRITDAPPSRICGIRAPVRRSSFVISRQRVDHAMEPREQVQACRRSSFVVNEQDHGRTSFTHMGCTAPRLSFVICRRQVDHDAPTSFTHMQHAGPRSGIPWPLWWKRGQHRCCEHCVSVFHRPRVAAACRGILSPSREPSLARLPPQQPQGSLPISTFLTFLSFSTLPFFVVATSLTLYLNHIHSLSFTYKITARFKRSPSLSRTSSPCLSSYPSPNNTTAHHAHAFLSLLVTAAV